jgi:hypothetical protein
MKFSTFIVISFILPLSCLGQVNRPNPLEKPDSQIAPPVTPSERGRGLKLEYKNGTTTIPQRKGEEYGTTTIPAREGHGYGKTTIPQRKGEEYGTTTIPAREGHEYGETTIPQRKGEEYGTTTIPAREGHEYGTTTIPYHKKPKLEERQMEGQEKDSENDTANFILSSCRWVSDLPRKVLTAPGCSATNKTRVCIGYVSCKHKNSSMRFNRMVSCREDYCGEGTQEVLNCIKDSDFQLQNPASKQKTVRKEKLHLLKASGQ